MKILFFLMLFVGQIAAQSAMEKPHTTIDNNFVTEQLSAERLKGFEYRAKQKLTEFANYIQLISNSEYDTEMRQHAMKLALALFEMPTNTVLGAGCSGKCTAQSFFAAILNNNKKIAPEISDVQVIKPFSMQQNKYIGLMSFRQKQGSKEQQHEIQIILKKIEKNFGGQKQAVWEVRLGDMK